MDRTRNGGSSDPDETAAAEGDAETHAQVGTGTAPQDPFKERLERDARRRDERRDPRIARPVADPLAAAAGAGAGAAAAAQPAATDESGGRAVAAGATEAPEVIIAPGAVLSDRAVTELVENDDGEFVLPAGGEATPMEGAVLPLAGAGGVAGLAPAGAGQGAAPTMSMAQRAFARASDRQDTAGERPRRRRGALGDGRQDDVAAGAIAAVVLLVAGWMGLQGGLKGREAAPGSPEPDSARVSVAAAPADPLAGAPVDLRPRSALPEGAENESVFTPAAVAAEPLRLSPAVLPAVAFSTAFADLDAPATEEAPALPVSCDPNMVVRAYFCTAKTGLTPGSRALLEREMANLKACAAGRELLVTGFADTRGVATMNAGLSAGRAETVAQFLRGQGLSVATVTGAGELGDLEDGRNCANQRRVDITFKDGAPPASRACAPPEALAALTCG